MRTESSRRLAVRVGLSLLVLLTPACTAKNDGATATSKPRVALVMKSLANEFFATMQAGAQAHQRAHPGVYELSTNGIKDEQSIGKQSDLVEQMVAQGADAIVLAPADSKALVSAVRRAVAAGVVVVNIDNRLDAQILSEKALRIPFVGPSNREGAAKAGSQLAAALGAGAQVAIIEGLPTAENARQRRLGFEDAIKAGGLELVAVQAGNWEMSEANQVAAALLIEHPDLAGIMCANDSMAMGVVAALKAAGKLDQIKVIGFDNIAAAQELIREGTMLATVEQNGSQLAVYGIEYALELLSRRTDLKDKETPVSIVTKESQR